MAVLDLGKVVPEKGVDYFTQSDINSFIDDVKTELKVSDLQNDAGYITKDANDLTYYYTKTEVDGKVSSVYKYKGSVATYNDLPSTGLTIGDVYNVESDGSNYAWNGTSWDKLGGDIDLSGYQTKIDSNNKLSAGLVDDTNTTEKFTNTTEKNAWNAKYDKPANGIPKSDLSTEVQNSLGKADTAIQDISSKQDVLVSGTNIKTINNNSLLGSGDITISGGQTIQYDTMPTASIDNLGEIIQYTGTTDSTYTNGYFYKCVDNSGTYSWVNVEVQPAGSIIPKGTHIEISNKAYHSYSMADNYNVNANYFTTEENNVMLEALNDIYSNYYVSGKENYLIYRLIGQGEKQSEFILPQPIENGTPSFTYYNEMCTQSNGNTWFTRKRITLTFTNYKVTKISFGYTQNNDLIAIGTQNGNSFTPTGDYHPSTKLYTDKTHYENMANYDAAKTQTLKNVNGTLTWVDD